MKILLLAGTGEALALAEGLVAAGHDVMASMAGATRSRKPYPCPTRIGGFGGGQGFLDHLARQQPDLVIDATHPFAERITKRTAQLCEERGVSYLQLLRPPWPVDTAKSQYQVKSYAKARDFIAPGARVFLATGRQTLGEFATLSDCYLICRQIDPPEADFPFPNGEYLIGRPPFTVEDEVALFKQLEIDWLLVKNAGGAASYSKIEAAALLGIPVLLFKRPETPKGHKVETVQQALDWVDTYADY